MIFFRDDQLLVASEQYIQTFEEGTATLEILTVYPTDSGTYKCTALNFAGEDSCVAVLDVKSKIFVTLYFGGTFNYSLLPEK